MCIVLIFMINQFILKEFGDRIRQLRQFKGISQEALAGETGFHRTYIGMIERGERNISLTNIAVFARVFNLNISSLLDLKAVNRNHDFKNYQLKS